MATELATAYISLIPSMKGQGSKIASELGGPAATKAAAGAGAKAGRSWAASAKKAALTGGALAATAVAGFAAYGVKEFAKFEKGMNEVFTLMPGMSKKSMGAMTDDTRAFAREMGITANEVTPALYQAISAGVPKENVFNFLETAQKAAVGGVTDLTTAVDGISSVVNAYGEDTVDATQASDLMFTAVKLGKTNFEELSASLFNVTPTASALGVEFGDVTAALAAMTAQGVPTSVATTQMRQLFVELSKEGSKTAQVFEEVSGKSFKDFIANGGDVNGALELLGDHAKDSGIGINDLFGSVEAGSAALALYDNKAFTDAMAEMENSAGATDAAYAQMDQGLGRTWEKIKATFNDAAMSLGEELAPVIQEIATWLSENLPTAVKKTSDFIKNDLIPAVKSTAKWIGDNKGLIIGLVAAITTYKAIVIGSRIALAAWTAATKAWTVATKIAAVAQRVFNAVMRANPIGLIITAIGLVVGALVWFFTKTKVGKKIIAVAWAGIKAAIKGVSDWWTKTAWPAIKKVIDWFGQRFKDAKRIIATAWAGIKAAAKTVWEWVRDKVFKPIAVTLLKMRVNFINAKNRVVNAWNAIKAGLRDGWHWIRDNVFSKLKDGVGRIKDAFVNVKNGIKSAWDKLKQIAAKPVNFILGTVYNDGIRKWWNKISGAVGLDSLSLPKASMVQFANGSEDHRAQIAPAGAMRLWAEPETGGEAYIPLASSKRGRSTAILADVANRFGYSLTQYADGGFWDKVGGAWSKTWRGAANIGKNIWNAGKMAVEIVKDPIGAIKKAVGMLAERAGAGGNSGDLFRIVGQLPGKFADGLGKKVKSLFDSGQGKGAAGYGGSLAAGKGGGDLRGNLSAMAAQARALDPTVRVTSGYRPGAITATGYRSYHGRGRAIDMVSANMGALWDKLYAAYGKSSPELFFSGRSFSRFGKKGIPRSDHWDHVHWAMANGGILPKLYDQGGWLPTGTSVVQNNTGRPEPVFTGDQFDQLTANGSPLVGTLVVQNEHEAIQELERLKKRRMTSARLTGARR